MMDNKFWLFWYIFAIMKDIWSFDHHLLSCLAIPAWTFHWKKEFGTDHCFDGSRRFGLQSKWFGPNGSMSSFGSGNNVSHAHLNLSWCVAMLNNLYEFIISMYCGCMNRMSHGIYIQVWRLNTSILKGLGAFVDLLVLGNVQFGVISASFGWE